MLYVIRREKGGATHYAKAVAADGSVSQWAKPFGEAVKLDEFRARGVYERIKGRRNGGSIFVDGENGEMVAGCHEVIDPPAASPPHQGEHPASVEPSYPADPQECVIVGDTGPFGELHTLLGMTTDPHATTLRDVAASALQEIKDLRELMDSDSPADPDATKLVTTPAAPAAE